MSKAVVSYLPRCLIELAWYFGPKGPNGECCDNLTMPEFIALEKVQTTRDCPVQHVGSSLGFTKSGATRIVNRLEKKGYVNKARSSDDARVCCVEITESGEKVLASANSRYLEQFNLLLSKMPDHSGADVAAVVTAMAAAMRS